jgi:hypothetical protein
VLPNSHRGFPLEKLQKVSQTLNALIDAAKALDERMSTLAESSGRRRRWKSVLDAGLEADATDSAPKTPQRFLGMLFVSHGWLRMNRPRP